MFFEERPRLASIGNIESFGRAAGLAQRCAQCLGIDERILLLGDGSATDAKSLVGQEVIVLIPACDIGPRDRRILAAADLNRPLEARIGEGTRVRKVLTRVVGGSRVMRSTRGIDGEWSQRHSDQTKRGGVSSDPTRVSERFRCQPASSSDRVRPCRGRMSKHR
jgi:hypothetical protein